ncbi:MAG: ABC transporter permease [Atribacterota bacterium]
MEILSLSLFQAMLRMSMPVLFAALGGMFCERAGVINIGLEGIMLNSAFFAVLATFLGGNPWIGLASGVLSGIVLGFVIALLTVKYHGNQVVVGTGINVFGLGFSAFLCQKIWGSRGASGSVVSLPLFRMPYLERLLGENTALVYIAFLLIVLSHLFLFHTPWGLRLRAVGENPQAADTAGVNVFRYRMFFVTLGSGIAGLGGIFLSLAHLSFFAWGMTSGRGFMGLAAMIFGKWTPLGCFLASLLFGFTDALQMRVQALGVLPSQIILLFPYVVTILVLCGFVGKALPPSDYKPYEKR